MSVKMILQLYEEDVPLTLVETGRVIHSLKDEDIRATANSTYTEDLPRKCDNKEHQHFGKCVGGGICLAKKYKRLFSLVDKVCVECESKVIIDTLNYIFKTYYEGKYRAEWKRPRNVKKPPPRTKVKDEQRDAKQAQIEALNNMGSIKEKKKKERPKLQEKIQEPPKEEAPVVRRRQRITQGRPGRALRTEA